MTNQAIEVHSIAQLMKVVPSSSNTLTKKTIQVHSIDQ
jgi:hypothetical protein